MACVFDIICGCHVCFARHGCSIILCGTFAIWRHLGINIRVMSRIWMNVFMSPLIVTPIWKVMPWCIYVCLRKPMRNFFTLKSPAPRPDEVLQQLPNEQNRCSCWMASVLKSAIKSTSVSPQKDVSNRACLPRPSRGCKASHGGWPCARCHDTGAGEVHVIVGAPNCLFCFAGVFCLHVFGFPRSGLITRATMRFWFDWIVWDAHTSNSSLSSLCSSWRRLSAPDTCTVPGKWIHANTHASMCMQTYANTHRHNRRQRERDKHAEFPKKHALYWEKASGTKLKSTKIAGL